MSTRSIPTARTGVTWIGASRWAGLAVTLAAGTVLGLLQSWLVPRGPITTLDALASMASALAVGIVAGWASGSRWSVLLTPVAFMAAFEVARLGATGPTVDGIRLESMFGIIAFAVGRGMHAVLAVLPIILGALYGVQLAAGLGRAGVTRLGIVGWAFTAVLTLGLGAVAVLVAGPARVTPILGTDGQPLPGSVAAIIPVAIGGHDQTVMIRGRSPDNPVILYVAGGPGGTDLGAMRADVTLEQDFVVATWEQRGVGKSYAALEPVETLTVEQMTADTVELANYLRERFAEERVYLVANSWGSILAIRAAQAHPELFHAVVGTGQMVSPTQTDRLFYEDALAWAERTGNTELVATLRENGPPPYDDLLAYEPAVGTEHDWNPYPELDVSTEMPGNLFVPENSLMDRVNGFRSFLDVFAVLYPQLTEIDFRRDAVALEVPYYMVLGAHEARGRAVPANEWFELLAAPSKERLIFAHSGHRPQFEEPGEFAALMRRVRDETYQA